MIMLLVPWVPEAILAQIEAFISYMYSNKLRRVRAKADIAAGTQGRLVVVLVTSYLQFVL